VTSGRILIGDRVVNNVAPQHRDIAMVFQSYALYPHMTVYDNLAFGLRNQKVPKNDIDRRVRRAAGSRTIARPSATRWRCPPESCFGLRLISGSRSRISWTNRTRRSMSFFGTFWLRRPNSRLSYTVMCG